MASRAVPEGVRTTVARATLVALVVTAAMGAACAPPVRRGQAPPGVPAQGRPPDARTPLDEYAGRHQPVQQLRPVAVLKGEGYLAHVLELTSQQWMTPAAVDRTLWTHWLTIIVPDGARGDLALLYLTGGDNGDPPPHQVDPFRLRLALETGSVVAELRQVPNQPLVLDGSAALEEDELIALAWVRFLQSGDPLWLPRLPMTRSAVAAMDEVTSFCSGEAPPCPPVHRFVVAGRSKRGWTTWTTAAVDGRVAAIVPMVIDVLNLEAQLLHHHQVYGFWAEAVAAYERAGFMEWLGTPELGRLLSIVDPYSYRSRLQMPKLIINAAGDEFFVPDSAQHYIGDLPGETLLRYVPNTGHSLGSDSALETFLAFFRAIKDGTPRPQPRWSFPGAGAIEVQPGQPPQRVRLWQATNPEARDFRLSTLGRAWTASDLTAGEDGAFRAQVAAPARGWTAFFLEMTFPASGPEPLLLTTPVRVMPEGLPFPAHGTGP